MKRLHLCIVLLIAGVPIHGATAGDDFIFLKNGGVIRGELRSDSKAADKKTTLSIRTHSGAVIAVDRDEGEVVSRRAQASHKDSVKKVPPHRRVAPVLLAA